MKWTRASWKVSSLLQVRNDVNVYAQLTSLVVFNLCGDLKWQEDAQETKNSLQIVSFCDSSYVFLIFSPRTRMLGRFCSPFLKTRHLFSFNEILHPFKNEFIQSEYLIIKIAPPFAL